MPFNWTCPYCDRDQVVVNTRINTVHHHIYAGSLATGDVGATIRAIGCSNPKCNQLTVSVSIHADKYSGASWELNHDGPVLFNERVIPRSSAKPQPHYIPAVIREDYLEACLIKDLSPKAAATLARRCIQGMIRDFCGISRKRLIDEIRDLRKAVDDRSAPHAVTLESVDAIDHVRNIGNIGAHMEQEIDVIVPVEPIEAQALIELIELLLREWYVDRHQRQERLATITMIAAGKEATKLEARAARALPAPEATSDG